MGPREACMSECLLHLTCSSGHGGIESLLLSWCEELSLLMLPKFHPLQLLLIWLGWIFPRGSSVSIQLKEIRRGGCFFLQTPLTKPCQISGRSVNNPTLSLLGLSGIDPIISSDPWRLHCLSCTLGWGMFSWEKVYSLTVPREHWPAIRHLMQIRDNSFCFQRHKGNSR